MSLKELKAFATFQEVLSRVQDRKGQILLELKTETAEKLYRCQGAMQTIEWFEDMLDDEQEEET